ncbi:hypothetical protein VFPPC_07352 [Pochonia chlamydosporia 170]|uniref:Uncharacterized protein n=1 Tax=Pochonia chlamydosporia 170 TaxID=1380566 RepID=A0A179F922_METCM|nr:hypothetical protein VFPPC_07352 [Pochonia chlamydosporia 170]OAQ61938.1 hypothetical protein VFPPC_07352 [Pochonia chlamydosporia 170]
MAARVYPCPLHPTRHPQRVAFEPPVSHLVPPASHPHKVSKRGGFTKGSAIGVIYNGNQSKANAEYIMRQDCVLFQEWTCLCLACASPVQVLCNQEHKPRCLATLDRPSTIKSDESTKHFL